RKTPSGASASVAASTPAEQAGPCRHSGCAGGAGASSRLGGRTWVVPASTPAPIPAPTAARSALGGAVDEFAQDVGVAVVLRVFLDHVEHHPAHVHLPDPAVLADGVEVELLVDRAAAFAGGEEVGHVLLQRGAVVEEEVAVAAVREAERRGLGAAQHHGDEPYVLDLGQVPNEAVQRIERGDDATISLLVVETVKLRQQFGAVVLEPFGQGNTFGGDGARIRRRL